MTDDLYAFVRRGQAAQSAVDAIIADAQQAHALYVTMRTEELLHLQAAHEADAAGASTPQGIAFGAGRLALIAAVLKLRETSE